MKIYSSYSQKSSSPPPKNTQGQNIFRPPQEGSHRAEPKKIPILRWVLLALILWWGSHALFSHFKIKDQFGSFKKWASSLSHPNKKKSSSQESSSFLISSSSPLSSAIAPSSAMQMKSFTLNEFARKINDTHDAIRYKINVDEVDLFTLENSPQIPSIQRSFVAEAYSIAIQEKQPYFTIEFALEGHNRKSAVGAHFQIAQQNRDYTRLIRTQDTLWLTPSGCVRNHPCPNPPLPQINILDSSQVPLYYTLSVEPGTALTPLMQGKVISIQNINKQIQIKIHHQLNTYSTYSGVLKTSVKVGQVILKNQKIANILDHKVNIGFEENGQSQDWLQSFLNSRPIALSHLENLRSTQNSW